MKYWNHFTTWIRKSTLLESANAFYILHVSFHPFPVTALLIILIFNFAVLNFCAMSWVHFSVCLYYSAIAEPYLLHWKSCFCPFLPPLLFHPLNAYWSDQVYCVQKAPLIHVYWRWSCPCAWLSAMSWSGEMGYC